LLHKKGREEQNCFIVEGERFVKEIGQDWRIKCIIVSEDYAKSKGSQFECKANVFITPEYLFKKISDTVTPQGIIAVCEKRLFRLEEAVRPGGISLLCDRISDPGNLGTLIRTANAAGADCAILLNSCELYNPKVIRSSTGSVFHLPCIEEESLEKILRLFHEQDIRTVAAVVRDGTLVYDAELTPPVCLMVGSEACGLSDELIGRADMRVVLPMRPGAESLNASVAGSVLLYEIVRQRLRRQI
jgi:TrmH family RNA methyltransferase